MADYTLLYVESPLQAICSIEAIDDYHIENYKILVIDNVRLNQIEYIYKKNYIAFDVIPYKGSKLNLLLDFVKVLNPFRGVYDSLIMGNYMSLSMRIKLLPLLKNNGRLIYLDDGTGTISLSQNKLSFSFIESVRLKFSHFAARIRGISDNNFYTIFADCIHREDWNVKKNSMNILKKELIPNSDTRKILIIGAPVRDYCNYLGIELHEFEMKLNMFFKDIQNVYPECKIEYIPHGRDKMNFVEVLCHENNIDYTRLDICVELYLYEGNNHPQAVYGFSSAALMTIHKMCPEIKMYNLLVLGGKNEANVKEYDCIASEYSNEGIKTITI